MATKKTAQVEEENTGLVDVTVPEVLSTNNFQVNEIIDIGYYDAPPMVKDSREKRGLKAFPMLKVVWRPLSFELDRNPDNEFQQRQGGPFDSNVEWITMYNNEGQLLGPNSTFGKFKDAMFAASGVHLSKNDVFRPLLIGGIFTCERYDDSYVKRNPDREDGKWVALDDDGNEIVGEDGKLVEDVEAVKRNTRHTYYSFPVERLEEYNVPPIRRTVRVGYGTGGVAEATVSAEQIDALKRALHGKAESEYADALFDSEESDIIMTEPFMSEAAEATRLTARMVKAGGKVLGDRLYFPELED